MSRYVEFELPDGGAIIFESDELDVETVQVMRDAGDELDMETIMRDAGEVLELAHRPFSRWAGQGEAVTRARQSFEQAAENARHAALVVLDKLRRGFVDPPDEVEITFGLKASGELGTIVVARAGAEASYSVTLKWKKSEAKPEAA